MKQDRLQKLASCEVVRVDCPEFLVNSQRQACRYALAGGAVLGAGYYLVCWPVGSRIASYGPELRYLGPHATSSVARFLHASALSLGLLEAAAPVRARVTARVFSYGYG